MKPSATPSVGFLCLALAIAPAAAVGFQPQADQKPNMPKVQGREATLTGCLTAAADGRGYALTTTDPDPLATAVANVVTDVRPTFTYELVGDLSKLRPFAGQRVTIKGRVDRGLKKDVEVDKTSKGAPRNTSGEKAQVKVTEEAEIEVRRMQVMDVSGSGETCKS